MSEKYRPATDRPATPPDVQGEGDYNADRRYRTGVQRFVATTGGAGAARQSAPKTAAEAAELLEAERIGRSRIAGAPPPDPAGVREPHEATPGASASAGAPPSRR